MKGKSFSVLELAVGVIFVIGLLLVGLSVLDSGKEERRDQERVSHINELRKALDLYRAETGMFPIAKDGVALSGDDAVSMALKETGLFRKAPVDPLHPDLSYQYQSTPDGDDYTIVFCQETDVVKEYERGCKNTARP